MTLASPLTAFRGVRDQSRSFPIEKQHPCQLCGSARRHRLQEGGWQIASMRLARRGRCGRTSVISRCQSSCNGRLPPRRLRAHRRKIACEVQFGLPRGDAQASGMLLPPRNTCLPVHQCAPGDEAHAQSFRGGQILRKDASRTASLVTPPAG